MQGSGDSARVAVGSMYDLACSSTTEFFVATTGPVARQGSVAGLGLVEEIQAVANELLRVLEECTVTRVRIHDQLSLRDALGHQERVVCRDHHVVRPIHDENR